LAQLSKKSGEGDLNIQQEFTKILGDPTKYPIQTGLGDNLEFKYNSVTDKYPVNPDNFGFDALRNNLSATHVNLLARLKDPRVFVTAEPASYYIDSLGLTAADFGAYVGAPFDESVDEMATKVQAGRYSLINRARYYSSYTAENCIQVGYPEMCFNIAEAIHRGWVAGDAAEWYKRGITASMAFYGFTDAAVVDAYINSPEVKYVSGAAQGLTSILEQKYIALFMHSGMESYFTWRRTGIPAFAAGGAGTGNSGVIPRRFQYPTSERDNNKTNYQTALQRQFGNTNDNINDKLWIEL
jgi:Starch-binding associating with outer membrane